MVLVFKSILCLRLSPRMMSSHCCLCTLSLHFGNNPVGCQLTKGVKWKSKVIFKASLSGKYLLLCCDARGESLCRKKMRGGFEKIAAFGSISCGERWCPERNPVEDWKERSPTPTPSSGSASSSVPCGVPVRTQPQLPSEKHPSPATGGCVVKGSGL